MMSRYFDTCASNEPIRRIAKKLMWWMQPDEALRRPVRFAAQVMTIGSWEDVLVVRANLGDEMFRHALLNPPAGVFDSASWLYWHHFYRIHPIPALPKRHFN